MKYAELFAGAGGMSLGIEAAGFHALAHAEIEPHARAVLRHRWPEARLDGDVTKIDGADYRGITLLSGGSPCQDLSVAGKRAGLVGSRSSLFHEQCRIWRESNAPYLLWENVLGALSSNDGADFATVLSTIVGSTVAVPRDGWGGGGGVVAGREAVAAWRVLDLQHFGPPQRRVRVFILAARAGNVDPAEVLALSQGVCGHPSPRQQSREGTAARVGGGAESGVMGFTTTQTPKVGGDVLHTLEAASKSGGGQTPAVIAWDEAVALNISNGVPSLDDTMGTLDTDGASTTAIGAQTRGVVIAFESTGGSWGVNEGDTSPPAVLAFGRSSFGGWDGQEVTSPVCSRDAKDASSIIIEQTLANGEDVTATLTLAYADKQGLEDQHVNSGCPLFVISSGQANASINAGLSPTLDTTGEVPIAVMAKPRRLTPLECERLMSWPDQWTATGRKDDGTEYALSDTARYRLCGNGVGSVCAEWIARRLHDAITGTERRVKFAIDCAPCECCDEPWCADCGDHYADCGCVGPDTEEGQ